MNQNEAVTSFGSAKPDIRCVQCTGPAHCVLESLLPDGITTGCEIGSKQTQRGLFSLKLSICQSISLYFPVCTGFHHSRRSYNVNDHLCIMALGQTVIFSKLGVGTTYLARKDTITTNCARSTNNGCLMILSRSPFTLTMLGFKRVTLYENPCRLVPDVMRVDVLEEMSGVKKYVHRML